MSRFLIPIAILKVEALHSSSFTIAHASVSCHYILTLLFHDVQMTQKRPFFLLALLCISNLCGTTSLNAKNLTAVELQHVDLRTSDYFQQKESTSILAKSKFTNEIFQRAIVKAIGGGVPGAIAGVVQVLGLMWLVS